MHKQFYFLSPVEVVKVTPQNMEEVAEWCGGKVAQVENKRKPGEMTKFVWVPTPKSSPMPNAYPGMYVTKRVVITVDNQLKTTFSVFRKDYIDKNYFDNPTLAVDATWERLAKEERKASKPVPQAPKKQPVVPLEKLMGPEYAQDTPAASEGVVEPSMATTPLDSNDLVDNTTSIAEKTPEEKLKEAYETIQELKPGTVIVEGDGKPGPTAETLSLPELASRLAGGEKVVDVQSDGDLMPPCDDRCGPDTHVVGCPVWQAELEVQVAEGKISVNGAREALGLPPVENLGGLFEELTAEEAKKLINDPNTPSVELYAAREYLKSQGYHESVYNKGLK